MSGYGAEYCRRQNDDVCHRLEFFRHGHDQIGITPSRLLAKMNSASVENLVRQMPITSGMNIFLLNATTGKMLATTRQDVLLYELQDSDRLEEGNLPGRKAVSDQCENQ